MILKLYRDAGPVVILVVLATTGLIWFGSFSDPFQTGIYVGENSMPGWVWIASLLKGREVLSLVISIVISVVTAFSLVWLNSWLSFINTRTLLPAALFVMLTGIFILFQNLHPAAISVLFLLLAIKRIIDGYRKPGIGNNFFDAGFLIAAGSFFYANLIWFGVLVIIGIFLFRTFNARDLFLTIAGILTPYILIFSFYYVLGLDVEGLQQLFIVNLFRETGDYFWTRPVVIASLFTAVMILLSLFHLFSVINSKKIRSRKVFLILVWILVISIAIFFFSPSAGMELVLIGAVPASLLISHYLIVLKNRRLTALLFGILFALVAIVQIMRHSW